MADTLPPITDDQFQQLMKSFNANRSDTRRNVLAYFIISYLALFTVLIIFRDLPQGLGGNILSGFAGAALMLVKDVYGYDFGSSKSSEEKNSQISSLIAKTVTPTSTTQTTTVTAPVASAVAVPDAPT